MDMDKEFGVSGASLFKAWEWKYAEIEKSIRFGGANPEEAYMQLKVDINDEINKRWAKSDKWKKFGIIMVFVCIACFLLVAVMPDAASMMLLCSIAVTVFAFKMKSSNEKVIDAALTFDEKYFGGEIAYRRKNG